GVSVGLETVGEERLDLTTYVSIFSYRNPPSVESIKGDEILSRPVYFRVEENNSNNTLVFNFNFTVDEIKLKEFLGKEIDLLIRFNFTNLVRLDLCVKVQLQRSNSGLLTILSIERTSSKDIV